MNREGAACDGSADVASRVDPAGEGADVGKGPGTNLVLQRPPSSIGDHKVSFDTWQFSQSLDNTNSDRGTRGARYSNDHSLRLHNGLPKHEAECRGDGPEGGSRISIRQMVQISSALFAPDPIALAMGKRTMK